MNWRRVAIGTVGTLAALGACAALTVHALVDTGRIRQLAQDKVKAASGHDLQLGDLSLALLPWPAVHATRVALSAPSWSHARNVLEVEQLDANLELVPLFVGKVEIKSLSLAGVKAALEEADDGERNWSLGGSEKSEGRTSPVESPVQVGRIHLRDVVIHRRVGRVDSEPWKIDEADVSVAHGLRDVSVEAKVHRHDTPLTVKARFADLSQLGRRGATTQGRIDAQFAHTQATLEGRLPLERALEGHDVRFEAKSKSLDDVLAFMGFQRGATQPFALAFTSRGTERGAQLRGLALSLGDWRVDGALDVAPTKDGHAVSGALHANRTEWLKVLAASGGEVKPPRHDGQVFHEDPVAWRALAFLGAIHGRVEIAIDALKLGNGLQVENLKGRATMGDGVFELSPWSAAMLGGTAGGTLRFEAAKKAIRASFEGDQLLLEQWFSQRGSKIPFRGGPMKVKATLAFNGETYRDLAESMSGPVTLRMGKGTWVSPKAGEIEEKMVAALQQRGTTDLEFQCASANLDFKRGRATGSRLVGAMSDVSRLLTAGNVDFRNETLDLRGRVQARKGITVGLATFAGGVRIAGPISKPRIGMDPDEKPALIARAAAALATAGATVVGEALLTAADRENPCEAVFR